MKCIRSFILFLTGVVISYFLTSLLGDGSFGISTSICFVGSIIYFKLDDNNSKNK